MVTQITGHMGTPRSENVSSDIASDVEDSNQMNKLLLYFFNGCAAYADGCAAYADGCAAYADGCAAYAESCAAYVRQCKIKAISASN